MTGPPQPNPPNPVANDGPATIIAPIFGRSDVTSALLGGSVGLRTPALAEGFGRPRLSLDLELYGSVASETSLARDGKPGEFRFPSLPTISVVGDSLILGSGTEVSVQPQSPLFVVSLGATFALDLGEDRLRVKPALAYGRSRIEVSAVSKRAVRLSSPNGSLDSYRLISLEDSVEEVYHGLGPALEIEYDLRQHLGPLRASLFLKTHALHLFGDLDTDLQQSNPEVPGEFVRWRFENERWVYRVFTGLRFTWDPRRR